LRRGKILSMGCRRGCCAFQLQLAPNGESPSERGGVGLESDARSIRESDRRYAQSRCRCRNDRMFQERGRATDRGKWIDCAPHTGGLGDGCVPQLTRGLPSLPAVTTGLQVFACTNHRTSSFACPNHRTSGLPALTTGLHLPEITTGLQDRDASR